METVVRFSVLWTWRRASEVIAVMTFRPSASNTLSLSKNSLPLCSRVTMVTSSSVSPLAWKLSTTLFWTALAKASRFSWSSLRVLVAAKLRSALTILASRRLRTFSVSKVRSPRLRAAASRSSSLRPTCAYSSATTSIRILSDVSTAWSRERLTMSFSVSRETQVTSWNTGRTNAPRPRHTLVPRYPVRMNPMLAGARLYTQIEMM